MEVSCVQVSEKLFSFLGCKDEITTEVCFYWIISNVLFSYFSKTALLEGLEVDQYMWGILNAIQK